MATVEATRSYYVSVRDEEANRAGFLLGPYDTHDEALANVDRGRDLAEEADRWSVFYAYGTCSVPAECPVKTVFGR